MVKNIESYKKCNKCLKNSLDDICGCGDQKCTDYADHPHFEALDPDMVNMKLCPTCIYSVTTKIDDVGYQSCDIHVHMNDHINHSCGHYTKKQLNDEKQNCTDCKYYEKIIGDRNSIMKCTNPEKINYCKRSTIAFCSHFEPIKPKRRKDYLCGDCIHDHNLTPRSYGIMCSSPKLGNMDYKGDCEEFTRKKSIEVDKSEKCIHEKKGECTHKQLTPLYGCLNYSEPCDYYEPHGCKTCKHSKIQMDSSHACQKNDSEKCRHDETWRSWISVDDPEQSIEAVVETETEPSKLRRDTICVDCVYFYDVRKTNYENHEICSESYYVDVADDDGYNECEYKKKKEIKETRVKRDCPHCIYYHPNTNHRCTPLDETYAYWQLGSKYYEDYKYRSCKFTPKPVVVEKIKRDCPNCIYENPGKIQCKSKEYRTQFSKKVGLRLTNYNECEFTPKPVIQEPETPPERYTCRNCKQCKLLGCYNPMLCESKDIKIDWCISKICDDFKLRDVRKCKECKHRDSFDSSCTKNYRQVIEHESSEFDRETCEYESEIPHFAEGGIVTSPMIYWGNGDHEVVVPLVPKTEAQKLVDESIDIEQEIMLEQLEQMKMNGSILKQQTKTEEVEEEMGIGEGMYYERKCKNCTYYRSDREHCDDNYIQEDFYHNKQWAKRCFMYKNKYIKEEVKEQMADAVDEEGGYGTKERFQAYQDKQDKPKSLKEIEKRIEEVKKKRNELVSAEYVELTSIDNLKLLKNIGDINKEDYKILIKLYISNDRAFLKNKKKRIDSLNAIEWKEFKLVFMKFKGIIDNNVLDTIKEKERIKEKTRELCNLTKCYEDKKKTKRTKVLLITCEYCGLDTPIDINGEKGKYCQNCGKEVKF